MLKKAIIKRLLVTLAWLALVTLLRWDWQLSLVNLWLGGLIGAFLLEVDHLLYILVIYPHELTSMRFKRFLEQRRFKQALLLLVITREERIRLTFSSALFQLILYGCCFFVLTSTNSLLGAGLVMAMALNLVREELVLLLQGREKLLRQRLFWQLAGEVSLKNQKFFVILMTLLFLGLNLLLI